jgi:hypothetical protein
MNQTGGWIRNDNIKWIVIVVLLSGLFYVGLLLWFRNTNVEGFDTEPLKYIKERALDENTVISISDSENGYYITARDSTTKKPTKIGQLPYGYYKVGDNTMAKIPYGFTVEKQQVPPKDDTIEYQTKLIPLTKIMKSRTNPETSSNAETKSHTIKPMLINRKNIGLNSDVVDDEMDGYPYIEDIPDGFYKMNEKYIGILPPNTMPNIDKVAILGTRNDPKLVKIYGIGYVNEAEYYKRQYRLYTKKKAIVDAKQILAVIHDTVGYENIPINPMNKILEQIDRTSAPFPLPEGVYYTEPDKIYPENKQCEETMCTPNTVQFLPYGKIAKEINGFFVWGFYDNPNLISKDGTFNYDQNYKDIMNDMDVTFHDSIEDIKAQNDFYDVSFGSIRVMDAEGNVVVLPRTEVQGDITYYTPGSYLFGGGTYVPKYEDSVYLSRTSHMPTMASYKSAFKQVGFCEADKQSPNTLETKCNTMDVNTCASTSCCVLLGGSKCVSGNENGPSLKENYGDIFVRNKDFYTHMGKCYGNCV